MGLFRKHGTEVVHHLFMGLLTETCIFPPMKKYDANEAVPVLP